jgi:hypothetical protein
MNSNVYVQEQLMWQHQRELERALAHQQLVAVARTGSATRTGSAAWARVKAAVRTRFGHHPPAQPAVREAPSS